MLMQKDSALWNHQQWSVDFQENTLKYCHQMSHFKAEMHQIRFRLGLCPRPRWGSSQCSPSRPPSWIKGILLLKGGDGTGRKGREGEGRNGKGRAVPAFALCGLCGRIGPPI